MSDFNGIDELIEDIRNGKMVILVDDEDRENEGDLVLAADHVTPTAINFMAAEARGLICLSLSSQQIDRLQLPLMVRDDMNFSSNKTAFTVSIEASSNVTTGISAADRAHTIRVASHPNARPADVHMPGHIFPIRAQQGGVLKRAGHTEGSVDLARMAGLNPAAVICEVMNPDGSMARVSDLRDFAKKHGLKIGTIVDLIQYRLQHESLVEEVVSLPLPSSLGDDGQVRVFHSKVDGLEHLVFQKGEINKDEAVLTRVHVDNYTRDLLQSFHYGDSPILQAWRAIEKEGRGVLIVLRGNNRPMIAAELRALMGAEEEGARPFPMDDRDYGIGAQILRAIGVQKIRLLSNRPDKRVGIKAFGLEILEIVPLDLIQPAMGGLHESMESGRSHKPLQ